MAATTPARPVAGAGTAALTLLAPVSWGTTYVVVAALLPPGRPPLVAALRVLPAALLLLAVVVLRHGPAAAGGGARAWLREVPASLASFGLFFPLLTVAVYRLPGGVAAAVGGLQPLLVLALSGALDRRRPRTADLAVGVVAAVGVGLVVVHPGAGLDPVGVLAAVAANVSFCAGVVLAGRTSSGADPVLVTARRLALSTVVLVPLALVVEGAPPVLDAGALVGVAWLGLGATGVAFVLWFRGIPRLPVAAPPLLGIAAPVTGVVLGVTLRGEVLSAVQVGGFVLSVAAIAYGALLPGRRESSLVISDTEDVRPLKKGPSRLVKVFTSA
ncbi:MAG: EamA family transporter [Actinobacteria bacterium]|nr:EamA family transporter [Actinomycetota bacterium]